MQRDSVFDLERRWFHVGLPLRSCTLKDIATYSITKAEMDELFRQAQSIVEVEKAQSQLDRGRWYSTQFLSRGTTADRVASAAVKLADTDFMFFLDGFHLLFDTARSDAHHYEAALRALSAVWAKTLPPRPLKKFVAQYFATLPPAESDAADHTAVEEAACRATDTNPADPAERTSRHNHSTENNSNHRSSRTHRVEKCQVKDAKHSSEVLSKDRRMVLAYWYLEDYLKRVYGQFLTLCESMLGDRVVQRRAAWLEVVAKLMCGVAEGRHTAMAMVLHKLGDSDGQIAHKAYHHLLKLLTESSTHQSQLFTELEKVVFATGCPMRTMRYAVNVMNQLVFSKDERRLAVRCVQTYLMLFRQLALHGGMESTVATAIMVGLRRAFPYAGTDANSLADHLNALFVIAHTGSFQQRVTTLALLQLLVHTRGTADTFQSRWYRALYHMLLISPKQVPQAAQMATLFTMLHRAMRSDRCEARVIAFVHRLLQRALYFDEAIVCAVLLLVSEVAQARPAVRSLLRRRALLSSLPHSGHRIHGAESRKTDRDEDKVYDPRAREPQHARAAQSSLWTLGLLARHAHPVVVRLAVLLLLGEEMVFDMHPLDDMTLANFLQMFVDAKARDGAARGAEAVAHDSGSGGGGASVQRGRSSAAKAASMQPSPGETGGVSVFRRAVHLTSLPSVSDRRFCQADARDVDVGALFMHRYAVQRERFIDSLSQVRSSWGIADAEADQTAGGRAAVDGTGMLGYDDRGGAVAGRVVRVDSALFGPGGILSGAAAEEQEEQHRAESVLNAVDARETKTEANDIGNDESEDEASLTWGAESEDDDDDDEEEEEESNDGESDADEDDTEVLGGKSHRRAGEAEAEAEAGGDDFAAVMEQHKQATSKRRRREEQWLDNRSAPSHASGSSFSARWKSSSNNNNHQSEYRSRGRGRGRGVSQYGKDRGRGSARAPTSSGKHLQR